MSITKITQSSAKVLRVLIIIGLLTGSTLLIYPPSVTQAQPPNAITLEEPSTARSGSPAFTEITVCLGGGCDYDNVQDAIDAAVSGDVIKIATGVYTDTNTASLGYLAQITQTLTLRGGYDAAFSGPPDPDTNPTVLDGEYFGEVVIVQGSGITVTLTGLTLQRGDGSETFRKNNLYVTGGASIVITGSQVLSATGFGIYLDDAGSAEIRDNVIAGNSDIGLESDFTRLTATGNTFTGNSGGMYLYGPNTPGLETLIEGNTLSNNDWGGIYVDGWQSSPITLSHNVISGHDQGVYVFDTFDNLALDSNIITGNQYGISIQYSHVRMDNNIIARNTTAGVNVERYSNPVLRHNTICDNPTGLQVRTRSTVTLTNTIVASSTNGIRTIFDTASVYSDHTLWYGNSNDTNLAAGSTFLHTNDAYGDPHFIGGADPFDAYHIGHGSAAIDAGRVTELSVDIDGEPRAPDIGVDEYPHAVELIPDNASPIDPGATANYFHTLRNTGSTADTFALTVTSDQGWTVSVEPLTATLNTGETALVTVTLTVPPAASIGQIDTTTVTATAQADTRVFDTAQDVTTVGVGVSLMPNRSANLAPGASHIYTHTLVNLGSVADNFDLVLVDPLGWASLLTATPVALAADATTTVQVQVTVPITGAAGIPFTAILTATSQTAPYPSDVVSDTTLVNPVSGDRYLSPSGGDLGNNCTDPATPCAHLNHAVGQAQSDEVIRIAAGVYTDTNTVSAGYLARITQPLTVRGGYDAAFSAAPDPATNPSVLDGEYLGQVVVVEGSGISVTLTGLTLQQASENNLYVAGGAALVITDSQILSATEYGLYLTNSGADIQDNVIAGNSDGGIYSYLTRIAVISNTLTGNGGGMELYAYSAAGLDSLVEGNLLLNNGWGGIYVDHWQSSTITVANNVISGHDYGLYGNYTYDNLQVISNTITDNGYAAYMSYSSHPQMNSNILAHSTSAGVYVADNSNPVLYNNTIFDNDYGIDIYGRCHVQMDNNIIAQNAQAGVNIRRLSSLVLRHNTISENPIGVQVRASSAVTLTNTIVSTSTYGIQTTAADASVYADHTLWYGVASETDLAAGSTIQRMGDVFGDPRFLGGADPFDAYHIDYDSAAIDAGRVTGLLVDIDGEPRAPDIGVDEYPHAVKVTPDQARVSGPDATIAYAHTLRNTGSTSGTFSLIVTSDQGWTVSVDPLTATLNSGETTPVTVTLVVPPGATTGQVDTTVVTATAQADPRIFDTAQDVTTVGVGLSLTPDRSASVNPGASYVYTHTLASLGGVTDTFDLVLTNPLNWASLLTSSPITLTAGATATVEVQVTTPITGATGIPFTSILTATSRTAPYPSDTVYDTTWVNPVAGDRYVSPSGSDTGNNCTDSATPCAHLNHTVGQSQPGDTIKIAAGVYTDTNTASLEYLVLITQTLTLRGGYDAAFSGPPDPDTNPTVLDGEYLGEVVVIEGSGITVTLTGLTLQRGHGYDTFRKNNLYVTGGASLVITDSQIISATGFGIFLDDAGSAEVRDNVIAANGEVGLESDFTRLTAVGNTVIGNSGGMYLYGLNTPGLNTLVEGNTLIDNDWGGIDVDDWQSSTITVAHNVISGHDHGLYVFDTFDSLTIDSNTITGNQYGVSIQYSHVRMDNNIIARNTTAGLNVEFPSNPVLRHNTISDNPTGVYVRQNSTVSLTNTIISSSTHGIRTMYDTSSVLADHTLWYGNSNDTTLTAGSTFQSSNDVYGDPRFAGGADPFAAYHIQYPSAAVEAGTDAGLAIDIDGDPRPRVPGRDVAIGADERANLPPVANAGIDRSVDASATITLDGSASFAPNGDYPMEYLWAQTGGPTVTLSSLAVVSPTFDTPPDPAVFTFTLVVTDSLGLVSVPDEVVITARLYYTYLPLVLRN